MNFFINIKQRNLQLFCFATITLILKNLILIMSFLSWNFKNLMQFAPGKLGFFYLVIVFISSYSILNVFRFTKRADLYIGIFSFFLSVIFLVDSVLGRSFGVAFSINQLMILGTFTEFFGDSIGLLRFTDMLFFVDLPIYCYIYSKIRTDSNHAMPPKRSKNVYIFVLKFIAGYIIFISLYSKTFYPKDIIKSLSHNSVINSINISPNLCHFSDLITFAGKYFVSNNLTKEKYLEVRQWQENLQKESVITNEKGSFKGKNIIILQFESLETFAINKTIANNQITPGLNKLQKNSLYFDNIMYQTAMGGSTDAVFLVNTSLYPVNTGASTFTAYSLDHLKGSLPRILKKHNYTTYAFEDHNKNTWNWATGVKGLGFDFQLGALQDFGLKVFEDKIYLNKVFDVLKDVKSPFYAHISTMSSHMPYKINKNDIELNLPNNIVNNYFEAIHYVDKSISSFISKLDKNGILENSLIVIYGDHESLHLLYKDKIPQFYPNETWMHENNLKIPVFIYSPSIKGRKIETNGGQIDIYPTIAYLLDIEDDADYKKNVLGRNLLNTKRNFSINFYKNKIFGNPNDIGIDIESIYDYSENMIENKIKEGD